MKPDAALRLHDCVMSVGSTDACIHHGQIRLTPYVFQACLPVLMLGLPHVLRTPNMSALLT